MILLPSKGLSWRSYNPCKENGLTAKQQTSEWVTGDNVSMSWGYYEKNGVLFLSRMV